MANKKNVSIMTDHGSWLFTDRQIQRIRQKDGKACAKFFEDNYDILRRIAFKFKSMSFYRYYYIEDLLNQVYVDLPYYSFSSRSSLYMSIYYSFFYVNNGGLRCFRKSVYLFATIDAPITEDSETTLADILISPFDFDLLEYNETYDTKRQEICKFLESNINDPKDLNYYYCKIFTNIPTSQIKGDEYETQKGYLF